ncbi:MAG: hypothetical protein CTY15_09595 [Methylocystis sp.]|nr:MAG: hypothetical protein CTY15_09595 [Methylocystis sp.]
MTPVPEALRPFAARIETTRKPILAADFTQKRVMSQLGGTPWWPTSSRYPTNPKGQPLFLLFQIDFSETPRLAPFPGEGLLQIFIDGFDGIYGADFDDPLASPGVAYHFHSDLTQPAVGDFSFLQALEEKPILPTFEPFDGRGLAFSLDTMTIDPGDYRFEEMLPEIAGNDDLLDLYFDWCASAAIRLGGYPSFTQSDPREYQPNLGDFTLLTIDTTDGIMWGDTGVAQFLMDEKALARRDFSQVAYNWDCG